jgi:hypothetical protein
MFFGMQMGFFAGPDPAGGAGFRKRFFHRTPCLSVEDQSKQKFGGIVYIEFHI